MEPDKIQSIVIILKKTNGSNYISYIYFYRLIKVLGNSTPCPRAGNSAILNGD